MFKFEKLNVWQRAIGFARLVYDETRTFPVAERFGLTIQIRRAASSISSNLAEGSARNDPDFSRFVGYAAGSLYEVVSQSFIARQAGFLNEDSFQKIYSEAEEISRMLSGLRDSLED